VSTVAGSMSDCGIVGIPFRKNSYASIACTSMELKQCEHRKASFEFESKCITFVITCVMLVHLMQG
jgi:hypothetical protein